MYRWRTVILSGLTLVALFCAGLAVHSGVDRWTQDRHVYFDSPAPATTPELEEVDALWGTVYLDGEVDLAEPARDADAYCAQGPTSNEAIFRNEDGSLRNVVIVATWKGAMGEEGEPTEVATGEETETEADTETEARMDTETDAEADPPEKDAVSFELSNCDYYPRVAQAPHDGRLHFSNRDQTFHVLVILDEQGDTWFRRVLKPDEEQTIDIDGYEGRLELTCGAHPWEHGFVQVAGESLVAITGDNGRYALTPEKSGTYRLVAWHERLGESEAEVEWTRGALEHSFTFTVEP